MSKQSRNNRSFMVRKGVSPTKERRRQNGGVIQEVVNGDCEDRTLVKRYRAVWECPLDAYLAYGAITGPEHKAGLKFRGAYLSALWSRRANYEALEPNTACPEPSKSERLLKQAYRTLSSHPMGAVIDICGHDLPARDADKLQKLKTGLSQLAELWRTAAQEVCWHK